ncbi:MAG: extracellular solute-binding protein [Deinococcus sp.]|nr:extracellular solute-binding protein [Deinococcus sp.]
MGYFNPSPNAVSYDDANGLFFNGLTPLKIDGSWLVADILDNAVDPEAIGFGILPSMAPGVPIQAAAGLGSAWSVSAKTIHPEEALKLIDWLISPANAPRWVVEGSVVPTTPVDASTLDVHPLTRQVLAGLPLAIAYNLDVVLPANVNEVTLNGIQAMLAGRLTPSELANEIQAAWTEAKAAGTILRR